MLVTCDAAGRVLGCLRGRQLEVKATSAAALFKAGLPKGCDLWTAGNDTNEELILRGGAAVRRGQLNRFRVASPATSTGTDPDKVAAEAWDGFDRRASVGGPRPVEVYDMALVLARKSIRRAIALSAERKDCASAGALLRACRLAASHPVWPYLTFLTRLPTQSAAILLASVLDVRWFVDLQKPDSANRLRSWLGVGVAGGDNGPHARRRATLRRCVSELWVSAGAVDPDVAMPGSFLARTARQHDGGQTGDARASRRAVKYLQLCWLDSVSPEFREKGEPLFEPRHFFTEEGEAEAFTAHLSLHR